MIKQEPTHRACLGYSKCLLDAGVEDTVIGHAMSPSMKGWWPQQLGGLSTNLLQYTAP